MGDTVRAIEMHVRKILDNISARHRAASAELREGCAAIERVNGVTMAYIRTRDDDDPYYLSPEEEKQMEADAEFERLHAENARQASVIADLHSALTDIAEICGDYGDGAPDDHYLAHLLLKLESMAKDALESARKALP